MLDFLEKKQEEVSKKPEDRFSRYYDPTNEFPNFHLRLSQWFLSHRLVMKKIVIGILIIWSALSIGFGLIYWAYYLGFGYMKDEAILVQQSLPLINYSVLRPGYSAQDLQIKGVAVFNSVSEDKYDFVAKAINPNQRWLALVRYRFKFAGGQTELAQTLLLPKSQRPLVFFGFESSFFPSNPNLVIEGIKWQRIDPHDLADIDNFVSSRVNFLVDNFNFIRASRAAGVPNHIIEFDIKNDSAYSYWEPAFYVELLSGGRTAGVIYAVVDQFKDGEVRHFDLRSMAENLEVDNVVVWPVINIFDTGVYMSVGS